MTCKLKLNRPVLRVYPSGQRSSQTWLIDYLCRLPGHPPKPMKTSIQHLFYRANTYLQSKPPQSKPYLDDILQLIPEKAVREIRKAIPIPPRQIKAPFPDSYGRYIISATLLISQESAAYNLSTLSQRQKEIIEKYIETRSYRGVAESLVISLNTIKMHMKLINRKLATKNMNEVIRYYLVATGQISTLCLK
jgi:DNA-binding CsgD family transcriptional regulator